MNQKAMPWPVPKDGIGFSAEGYPLRVSTARVLEGVSPKGVRHLSLLPWPYVYNEFEAMVDRVSRLNFSSDARGLVATLLFNVPDWDILRQALAELESYDVWCTLRRFVSVPVNPEQSWERKCACHDHPAVRRLGAGKVSAVRASGAFQPFMERGVELLPGTVRLKKIEYISFPQLEFMYGAWQRMAESLGLSRSAMFWCACFDVPEAVLQYVHKMGQRLEGYGRTVMDEREAAGIHALAKLKGSRGIYRPNRAERWSISGSNGYDAWLYASVKTYQSRLKDVGFLGLSFDWESGLSLDKVLNACVGSSARIKATESIIDKGCPAVAGVLCEEGEARALLRHGWPVDSFSDASEEDLRQAEIESGPLRSEGPWYMFYGA